MSQIKILRMKLGMSQRQFANYFEIPIVNIQHWEQGVSTPPSYVYAMMKRIVILENLDGTKEI